MKRFIIFLLSAVLVLGLAACGGDGNSSGGGENGGSSGSGDDADEIPENPASDFEYRTVEGGVEITGYKGSATEVRIPNVIEGAHVVSIARRAFENRSAITKVIIPDSVSRIASSVFNGCSELKNITLPDSLDAICRGWYGGTDLIVTFKNEIYYMELNNRERIILPEAFYDNFISCSCCHHRDNSTNCPCCNSHDNDYTFRFWSYEY